MKSLLEVLEKSLNFTQFCLFEPCSLFLGNESKSKKKGADEEDDDEPNTYDYNDSFINDASQANDKESSGESEESEEGSDEESGEDVSKLKKEAKKFIKNKKLTKPV